MPFRTSIAFGCLLLLGSAGSAAAQQGPRLKGYHLVWHDEFNYTGLPDSAKWGYEQGFVRNHESQYYTVNRPQNAYVHHGYLEICARKERYPNAAYRPTSTDWRTRQPVAQYTSASLRTLGKASWRYGLVEVRAKIPQGQGMWPAIWMLGTDEAQVGWPRCGEIDIMEFIGRDSTHIYGTFHYASASSRDGHASSGKTIEVQRPYAGYHVYSLEWTPDSLKLYFDRQLYQSFATRQARFQGHNPFRKPFFLILNLALGGAWGGPVDDRLLPRSYRIDYVRVYQKKR